MRIRIGFCVNGRTFIVKWRGWAALASQMKGLCKLFIGRLDDNIMLCKIKLDVCERESGDELAQKSLALNELTLYFLCMASGSERLPVSVLLVALDAGSFACCAAREL